MKCLFALAAVAITLVTAGCASPQPTRSCSGRVTTDNGHVIRNEEDCVWGNQYAAVQRQPTFGAPSQQTVYVVQQTTPAPQYLVAEPRVLTYPQLNLRVGNAAFNVGVRANGNQPRTITRPQRPVPITGVRVNGNQHNRNYRPDGRP